MANNANIYVNRFEFELMRTPSAPPSEASANLLYIHFSNHFSGPSRAIESEAVRFHYRSPAPPSATGGRVFQTVPRLPARECRYRSRTHLSRSWIYVSLFPFTRAALTHSKASSCSERWVKSKSRQFADADAGGEPAISKH